LIADIDKLFFFPASRTSLAKTGVENLRAQRAYMYN